VGAFNAYMNADHEVQGGVTTAQEGKFILETDHTWPHGLPWGMLIVGIVLVRDVYGVEGCTRRAGLSQETVYEYYERPTYCCGARIHQGFHTRKFPTETSHY
jgi:hypothetical protein